MLSVIGIVTAQKDRKYLLTRIEVEGVPSRWQYNGGRKTPVHLSDESVLKAIQCVECGESLESVSQRFSVNRETIAQCVAGKNRPNLLARLRQEAPVL
jgi:hypothetical protein